MMALNTLNVLVSGSLAYDFILQCDHPFTDQLIAPPTHQLNLGLSVNTIRREFGGCAGNIAYSLALLGYSPYIMTAVGSDASDYLIRLDQLGIHRDYLQLVTGALTARSFNINDTVKSQISVFHAGAMAFTTTTIPDNLFELYLLSPAIPSVSYGHAQSAVEQNKPFIFDPGPTISFFSAEELSFILQHAVAVILNENEMQRLTHLTGLSEQDCAQQVPAIIITLGEAGSRLYEQSKCHHIPVIPIDQFGDPTGCGDAYRAGLIYGIMKHWSWQEAAQLGSIIGSFCARFIGAQNHHVNHQQVMDTYKKHFGTGPNMPI